MRRGAVISDCGTYRYHLWRDWSNGADCRPLQFVMLNPSTADGEQDDPTIRRCINFAEREGCNAINVANLFAYRATDPKHLPRIGAVGDDNDLWLQRYFDVSAAFGTPLVAAWGAHKAASDRAAIVRSMAASRGLTFACLGRTKAGHPRHPLYVKGDQPLEVLS